MYMFFLKKLPVLVSCFHSKEVATEFQCDQKEINMLELKLLSEWFDCSED